MNANKHQLKLKTNNKKNKKINKKNLKDLSLIKVKNQNCPVTKCFIY